MNTIYHYKYGDLVPSFVLEDISEQKMSPMYFTTDVVVVVGEESTTVYPKESGVTNFCRTDEQNESGVFVLRGAPTIWMLYTPYKENEVK